MKAKEVNAVITACEQFPDGIGANVNYAFPETLAEASEVYGEAVALSILLQQVTVKLQGGVRTQLKAGKTSKEIQAWADGWKPGMAKPKKSALEKVLGLIDGIDNPDDLKAMLQKIQENRRG